MCYSGMQCCFCNRMGKRERESYRGYQSLFSQLHFLLPSLPSPPSPLRPSNTAIFPEGRERLYVVAIGSETILLIVSLCVTIFLLIVLCKKKKVWVYCNTRTHTHTRPHTHIHAQVPVQYSNEYSISYSML